MQLVICTKEEFVFPFSSCSVQSLSFSLPLWSAFAIVKEGISPARLSFSLSEVNISFYYTSEGCIISFSFTDYTSFTFTYVLNILIPLFIFPFLPSFLPPSLPPSLLPCLPSFFRMRLLKP
jgi:hypothetical protein